MKKSQYWEFKVKETAFTADRTFGIYNGDGRLIAEIADEQYGSVLKSIVSSHNYSLLDPDCEIIGFCPFNNKIEGFPCKNCKIKND